MISSNDIGRPTTTSTTKQCTKRDKPPCPDGGHGGGAGYDVFRLTCAAGFVRALADILEYKFGTCGDKDFAEATIRVAATAKRQAEIIDIVARRLAAKAGGGGNA
jgi:hypothetical protein